MPNRFTVLSVDDDEGLQTVVTHYLSGEGYKTLSAGSGAALMELLKDNAPNIILLDLVLPDTDGISILAQLRALYKIPVIVVSGKSDTTEKIVCLEMGADDYMTKPFEMRELSARIKAVLRRGEDRAPAGQQSAPEQNNSRALRFGDWVLDKERFQLFDKNNVSADLTTGEYRLLEALVDASNKVLSRERLFEITREGDYDTFDRAVDIQVGRLRKKLNDDPKDPQYIKTVRGIGYMFCGSVKAD
ncbi:MAG: DNA-binding response regulator [Micavibrio aeruginosavorus]|uniref:DNA-binding response regulator n=1 Tax=Micavibrio aeruginosavorus TaxID=349221 RepID=A0A2W5C059_9BACT|nr:MAG: DNA-binding response regulator [Micavibrio aeruginosavorus]